MPAASFLWRRLDAPGHDACRFEPLATGFRLAGMAAFRRTAALEYAYESPAHGCQATLKVTRIGAIAQYPGVFALE